MAQGSLDLGAAAAPLGEPLARRMSEAWEDLPLAWRELSSGLDEQARKVTENIDKDAANGPIAPARPFRAFELVSPERVRLILIGQDPYPLPGDANGLAFCSLKGVPRSMLNVYSALEAQFPGFARPRTADLAPWAEQGVLLLNAARTVRIGVAGSHLKRGWEAWTGGVLRALYERRLAHGQELPVAWLWGKPAQQFFGAALSGLPVPPERVLKARHPSNDYRKEFVGQARADLARLQALLHPPIRW